MTGWTAPLDTEEARKRSRRQLWLLIGMFFAPLLLAFLLYYGTSGWRPAGSTNHGDLIQPPRPLPDFQLPLAADGSAAAALELQSLHGKWNLVYIGDGRCQERCREALVLMRQTRLALNDDLKRVERVFLATDHCCDQAYLQAEHPDLITARADMPAAGALLQVFPGIQAATQAGGYPDQDPEPLHAGQDSGFIYIVDPLGNLMMSYSPQAPRRALLEDLRKLLKLSHIG